MKQEIKGILFIALLVMASCSPTRRLKEGEYLLVQNEVRESAPLKKSERDDISEYALPKTNKKFLGFWRLYLQIYNLPNPEKLANNKEKQLMKLNDKNQKITEYNATVSNPKKKKKYKKEKLLFGEWLQKNGEAPVLLDSIKIKRSKELLTNYAQNKGFFRAYVTDSVVFKKKTAKVIYTVHRGPATYLDTIMYKIYDPAIDYYIQSNKSKSKLKDNMKYDLQKFDDERSRILDLLKNNGYYFFNKDYLKYTADTITDSGRVRLTMRLERPNFTYVNFDTGDTVVYTEHRKFKINRIFVETDYDIEQGKPDFDTVQYLNYTFLFRGKHNYNPKIIAQSIYIDKDKYYSVRTEQRTQKALSELRNFKFISIGYQTVESEGKDGLLDCYIRLSPMPKQSLGIEAQGTNTNSQPGVFLTFNYANKNIFKGAELLEFRIFGGAEVVFNSVSPTVNKVGPFNSFEAGASASLLLNRFLFPVPISKVKKSVRPKTRFSLSFDYQTRPDYSRWVAAFNFGYEWTTGRRIRHIMNPAEISYVYVIKTDAFNDYIVNQGDQFVLNTFISHYIQASSYTFQFNSQELNSRKDIIFFNANVQWAGNILNLISEIAGDQKDTLGYHTVFGNIRYSQYVRAEFDFRYYLNLHRYHKFAFRAFVGVGIPYNNSRVMPFEKAFYIGGSSDLRAFLPRTMGPGSFLAPNSTKRVDQVGDLKLLFNAEYRGTIYRFLEGAIFADFGNIWLLQPDPDRPGGEITGKFIEELAFGAGAGLRLNFGFFVFRFDVALPFRDPRQPAGQRWVITHLKDTDVQYNVAVGYPF